MFVFISVKITDLIYKDIKLFWYRYFVYKMTMNFTEQIASKKKPFLILFFSSVYLCQSYKHIRVLLSILQILRGHMMYFVTWRRKRYENGCDIYGAYIKWPQNDL